MPLERAKLRGNPQPTVFVRSAGSVNDAAPGPFLYLAALYTRSKREATAMASDNMIDYEAVLADLESKRKALDAAIAGVRQMLGQSSVSVGSVGQNPNEPLTTNAFSQMSVAEAAESYLRHVRQVKTTAEISDALVQGGLIHNSENFRKTVSTILNQKARDPQSEITKTRDTKWGLSSWSPGMKRAKNVCLGVETEAESEAQTGAGVWAVS